MLGDRQLEHSEKHALESCGDDSPKRWNASQRVHGRVSIGRISEIEWAIWGELRNGSSDEGINSWSTANIAIVNRKDERGIETIICERVVITIRKRKKESKRWFEQALE